MRRKASPNNHNMHPRWTVTLLLILTRSACVRLDGRNSDCQWPPTPAGPAHHSLREDLELAEELATRYMDAHAGPRDLAAAARAKNRCMGTLLAAIGKERGITAQEAFKAFGQRSFVIDLGMILPFLLLYAFAADLAVRRILSRYPPVLIIVAAAVFAFPAVLLGQEWFSTAESIRIGTAHLSNRALRLPLAQHPVAAFGVQPFST